MTTKTYYTNKYDSELRWSSCKDCGRRCNKGIERCYSCRSGYTARVKRLKAEGKTKAKGMVTKNE